MAALTITAANVTTGQAGQTTPSYQTAEAITAGVAVYYDSSTSKVSLADNTGSTNAAVKGIALSGASSGGYILVAESGIITTGATMTVGHLYYLGNADGNIHPVGDITGDVGAIVSAIYRAVTTTTALLEINNTGLIIA